MPSTADNLGQSRAAQGPSVHVMALEPRGRPAIPAPGVRQPTFQDEFEWLKQLSPQLSPDFHNAGFLASGHVETRLLNLLRNQADNYLRSTVPTNARMTLGGNTAACSAPLKRSRLLPSLRAGQLVDGRPDCIF